MHNYIREKIADAKKQKESKLTPAIVEDSIKILKMRYAKGEISKEDFEEMKNDLK